VLGPGSGRTVPANSSANLIVVGEVARGFRPWGDPSNLRDPARPPDGGPGSFGNPSGTGAQFLFQDGSVRFLSRKTDQKVLQALAGPPGPGNIHPVVNP
jgi:hypothetical protein